jgi:hypothetical protein
MSGTVKVFNSKLLTTMGKVAIFIFVTAIIIFVMCSCSALRPNNIWEKDDLSLFEYIFEKLSDKSDFGSDLSKLNDKEKVFMSMALLEQEVNNVSSTNLFSCILLTIMWLKEL